MIALPLTIVDVETTGMLASGSRVIEIGMIKVLNGKPIKTFRSLVNPQQPVSEFISNLTGITDSELSKAPVFETIKDEVFSFFQDSVFVAHNVGFDYAFLKHEFFRTGVSLDLNKLCTVKLSRHFFPEYPRHNLSSLIDRFNISCPARHRAFDDAWVVWEFMQIVEKHFGVERFNEACRHLIGPQRSRV